GGGDAEAVAASDEENAERAGAGDAPRAPTAPQIVVHVAGQPTAPQPEQAPEDDAEDAIRPLSERLVSELTAHRTLALRDAVARNPRVAETLLLHKMVQDAFHPCRIATHCLEASVRHVFFPYQADDLKDSAVAQAVA